MTKYEINVVTCVHDREGAVWCTSKDKSRKETFTTFPYKNADKVRNVTVDVSCGYTFNVLKSIYLNLKYSNQFV